ncbi:MAG: hypothetical protein J7M12_02490 [Candidatus Hydrogenedentes bacterium]|nr:hypothetical protein [Candidatus Hydrogenedentota bacterium]
MNFRFNGMGDFEKVRLADLMDKSNGLVFFYDTDFADPLEVERAALFLHVSLSVVIIVRVPLQSEIRERVNALLSAHPVLTERIERVYWVFSDVTDKDIRERFIMCSVLFGQRHWPSIEHPLDRLDTALPQTVYRLTNQQQNTNLTTPVSQRLQEPGGHLVTMDSADLADVNRNSGQNL